MPEKGRIFRGPVKVLTAGELGGREKIQSGAVCFRPVTQPRQLGVNRPNCTPSVPIFDLPNDAYLVSRPPWNDKDSPPQRSSTSQPRAVVERNHATISKQLLIWHTK